MPRLKHVNYMLIAQSESPYSVLTEARQWHENLAAARIALAWRLRTKEDRDRKIVLGKCLKVTDLQKEFHTYDFIILLNQEYWVRFDAKQKLALVDHELCHARPDLGNTGAQKTDERGRLVWRHRKHDIEEFREIVQRHGCYKADLEEFAKAIRDRELVQQPSLLDPVPPRTSLNVDNATGITTDGAVGTNTV